MRRHYGGWLAMLVAVVAAGSWAETPPAPATMEHHIYLHVVQPKGDQPLRIIVADQPERPVVPAPADKPAEPEELVEVKPEETSPDEAVPEKAEPEEEAVAPALVETEDPVEPGKPEMMPEVVAEVEEDELVVAPMPPKETPDEVSAVTPPVELALVPVEPVSATERRETPLGLLLFIFVLAIFLGFELISKVPSQLHTPLMSGSNAISGITIVGALAAAGLGVGGALGTLLGTLAVVFATINVVGGYMVTNRMLAMFKKKAGGAR